MTDEKTNLKERQIVYPGQVLAEGSAPGPNCYKEGGKIISLVSGLANIGKDRVSVIPFKGKYTPKAGDHVIGVLVEDLGSVWLVDIQSPYMGILREERDSNRRGRDRRGRQPDLKVGGIVSTKIISVDEVKEPQLIRPWTLEDGYIIKVDPKKIPRVIGKNKSMLNIIKDKTKSNVVVGQNGLIWIKAGDTDLAVEAIRQIEAEAHTRGLTDRISEMLDNKTK
ncbi:MAG: RNA-binding protein [Candidatus Altiarchaeales archaeon]|nr:RNA-binding protein [Candidatus Altiarchaeales archaeon]